MYVPKHQRGVSLWGWIAILLLVIGAGIVSIRLFGPIRDHLTLMNVVESVYEDPEFNQAPMRDVKRALNTRLRINDVDHLKDVIEIYQPSGRLSFVVSYEVEKPLVANAYILLKFDEQLGP